MAVLIRLYQVVLITAAFVVLAACLINIRSAIYLVIFAIPIALLILFTVLTVEFSPDALPRGELESLLGLKRDGVLQRHAVRIGPRRTWPSAAGPSTPFDTPLDRLVRAKRTLPRGRGV
jgi:hypothetical protein